jgi:hypothetical protein
MLRRSRMRSSVAHVRHDTGRVCSPDQEKRSNSFLHPSASREATRRVITDRDVVYSSDRSLSEQQRDWEAEDFDSRLRQSGDSGTVSFGSRAGSNNRTSL